MWLRIFFGHEGIKYHNLEYYFAELLEEPAAFVKEGEQELPCQWIPLNALHTIDLRSIFLREKLEHWQGLEHIVINDRQFGD